MDLKIWMMPLIASGNKVMRRGCHSERKQSVEKWGSSHGPYGLLQPTAGKAKIQLSCDRALPEEGLSLCTFQLFTWKCSKQTIVKQLCEKGADAVCQPCAGISSGLVNGRATESGILISSINVTWELIRTQTFSPAESEHLRVKHWNLSLSSFPKLPFLKPWSQTH